MALKALLTRDHKLIPDKDPRTALTLLALLLAAQIYLIFYKSFNWDEFLHYSQVYMVKEGALTSLFQVLHVRILSWVPLVADSLVDQLILARFFMWSCTCVTLAAIYGLARQFTSQINAIFAAVAYLSAGYVFTHSFSIRADPMATATLMVSLYVLAAGRLTLQRAIIVGALVGLAGMITAKSVFYAPCFAGLAWWRFTRDGGDWKFIVKLLAIFLAALASFLLIYTAHKSGLPQAVQAAASPSATFKGGGRWFFSEDRFALFYFAKQSLLAVVFIICLFLAPRAWRKEHADRSALIAMVGLVAPLLVVILYRNTFPYFYVFLFAPIAVAIAPAIGQFRQRYGNFIALGLFSVSPLALLITEPRDVIGRQIAMIDYVHQEYPDKVEYLARSGAIADYPRVIKSLTTGNGIRAYFESGDPIVAKKITSGELAFVLATQTAITAALEGRQVPKAFLDEDIEALSSNFVQQWGPLYRAGKEIPAGENAFQFEVPHKGSFILDGAKLSLNGRALTHGKEIVLDAGVHEATGLRENRMILWRGNKLPSKPPGEWIGGFYTDF
ncbi:MAG TPA: hypothetical protein DCS24_03030 [Erythrobacter sp.]|nr:hypothetical protein [Erythrobacter sp.]